MGGIAALGNPMKPDQSFRLYIWQRASAALMVPFIVVHLVLMFYATRQQLTAADILARTRGSVGWAAFYGAFVLLAAVHGAIGVRTVMADWVPSAERVRDVAMWGFGVLLTGLGLRAVVAVIWPGML
jgi:fumarate reductase subunit C